MTAGVVAPEVDADPRTGLRAVVVGMQVDLVVLYCSPQAFGHDVIHSPGPTFHADLYAGIAMGLGERVRGERRALDVVEDLLGTVGVGHSGERFDAEHRVDDVQFPSHFDTCDEVRTS